MFAAIAGVALAARAEASWIFRKSYYSHDPATGERVAQYARPEPAYVPPQDNYRQSGYRHIRNSLRVGGSADNLHVVQTWGEGENIRPYGEWQFPYRPFATPYNGVWPYPPPLYWGGYPGMVPPVYPGQYPPGYPGANPPAYPGPQPGPYGPSQPDGHPGPYAPGYGGIHDGS